MLTTTLLENNAMVLNMPIDTDDPATISRDRIMTILVGENNNIYYYKADELDKLKETDYKNDGLRNLLYDNNKRVNALLEMKRGWCVSSNCQKMQIIKTWWMCWMKW